MSGLHEAPRTGPQLVAAALAVLMLAILVPEQSAALSVKQCLKKTCKKQKRSCVKAFKGKFKTRKALCTGSEKKSCRREAKKSFQDNTKDCKKAFKGCKSCCRSGDASTCSVTVCGDDMITGLEECDDGSRADGDGCSAACFEEPRCGNGEIEDGEQCETKANCQGGEICSRCTCIQEPVCGNGIKEVNEDCDPPENESCPGFCLPDCACPVCGDGKVDPGEECESDGDCGSDEFCSLLDCTCGPRPLGSKHVSFGPNPDDEDKGSKFYTSFRLLHDLSLGAPRGELVIEAGPNENGIAKIAVTKPFFITIDGEPPIRGLFKPFTICTKVDRCTGELYCNGGVNVDVLLEFDSLKEGLTCEHEASCPPKKKCCDEGKPCCTNACEGVRDPEGSGNEPKYSVGKNEFTTRDDSGPGALFLRCWQAEVPFQPYGTNCADENLVNYPEPVEVISTTGKISWKVSNHCAGLDPGPLGIPQFVSTDEQGALEDIVGSNFDCSNWTDPKSGGATVFAVPSEEPDATLKGDAVNVGILR